MTKPLPPFAPSVDHASARSHAVRCIIGVFAHNEEDKIAACLASLPLGRSDVHIHVLVNGSTDRTAERARAAAAGHANIIVHERAQGGKSRTWNWLVHDLNVGQAEVFLFVDGDAVFAPGSMDALCRTLAEQPMANAAAGMPRNGRHMSHYQKELRENGGLFGDLYALPGRFVDTIRQRKLRLPEDLIGDDALIAAWAATNLGRDADWQRARLLHAEESGFYCQPFEWRRPSSWRIQYRRMISYAVRHFQNVIIQDIMIREGAQAVPACLATLYPLWLPRFSPRPGLINALFDRLALRRMRRAAKAVQGS